MYGSGGVVKGATTTGAGIALLPNTGGNPLLIALGVSAIALGGIATLVQLSVMGYRRYTLR